MNHNELTFRDLYSLLVSNIKWIALATVATAAIFLAAAMLLITPQYTAIASFLVRSYNRQDTTVSYSDLTASKDIAKTFSAIFKSDTVLDLVAAKLDGVYTTAALRQMISCTSLSSTEILQLSVTNVDPQEAMNIANTIAEIAPAEIVRITKVGGAEIIDLAKLPDSRSSPSYKRAVLFGGIVGFVLSFGILLAKKMLDTVVRTEEDLMNNFEYPVLGTVPQIQVADDEVPSGGKKKK